MFYLARHSARGAGHGDDSGESKVRETGGDAGSATGEAPDPLWRGVMDWLAGVGVGEPAAVAAGTLLEELAGPPRVAVRGPRGIGARSVADALRGARGTDGWLISAEEGPAPQGAADAVVALTRNPRAGRRPGEVPVHPGDARRGLSLADAPEPPPAGESGVADIVAEVATLLSGPARADARARRLRAGIAEIAAAHADVRDDLEELLWP